ncbi:5'-3' exoribonuclease 1-like, partial [Hyalella azteca]|uniref:5'-3' exoribonuclease 1-like n=1 Tax=Hyalella azteca TaxID=294128 RepID=A0A8B7PIH3_HYAAZ
MTSYERQGKTSSAKHRSGHKSEVSERDRQYLDRIRTLRGFDRSPKRPTATEETTYLWLHLSLLREYINHDFEDISHKLSFKYDLERIIDDWVFMLFVLGNDFIPRLPIMHIDNDVLPELFDAYKSVMPELDGYLNEAGILNLPRFQKFMAKLAKFDYEKFLERHDASTLIQTANELQNVNNDAENNFNEDGEEENNVNDDKREIVNFNENEVENKFSDEKEDSSYDGGELDGSVSWAALDDDEIVKPTEETLRDLDIRDPDLLSGVKEVEKSHDLTGDREFLEHKRKYYVSEMGYKEDVTLDVISREQTVNHVRGLQWILHYYYNGIQSWSWYYPFHCAPFISDIKDFSDCPMEFELSHAMMPFEQLMAVLPPQSAQLLPQCYADLMLSPDSPIIDFYPRDYDWDAVTRMPFISEECLLQAMSKVSHHLTEDERRRSVHGPTHVYSFTPDDLGAYEIPEHFPPVRMNHAKCDLIHGEAWSIPREDILRGLCPGAQTELYFPGFPTLKNLEHTQRVGLVSARAFQESVIIELRDPFFCRYRSYEWFDKITQDKFEALRIMKNLNAFHLEILDFPLVSFIGFR